MAMQEKVFKLVKLFGTCKNILNNRPLILASQQSYGLRQSTKTKLKDLNLPEKPKKPATPYIRYFTDQLSLAKQNNSSITLTTVAKKCSENWKLIDDTTKEKYEQPYKKELEIYSKKLLEYNSKLTDDQKTVLKDARIEKHRDKEKRKLRKFIKETNKPKRPLTPYIQFAKEFSKGANLKDLLPRISEKWKEMSENDKRKYQIRYEEEKSQYEKELKNWETKMLKEGNLELVRFANRPVSNTPPKSTEIKKKSTDDKKKEAKDKSKTKK